MSKYAEPLIFTSLYPSSLPYTANLHCSPGRNQIYQSRTSVIVARILCPHPIAISPLYGLLLKEDHGQGNQKECSCVNDPINGNTTITDAVKF